MLHFNPIAKKVLSQKQQELAPLLEEFWKTHFLIGWTAIALHLWHRKSIDYDFVNDTHQWNLSDFKARVESTGFSLERDELQIFHGQEFENQDEFHCTIHWVKLSLFNYFRTLYSDQKINIYPTERILWSISTLSLEQLLYTKLFACITRNKWKDAVDIYYLLEHTGIQLHEALKNCEEKYFINIFNSTAAVEQLISGNWDTSEWVDFLEQNPPTDKQIIRRLQDTWKNYLLQK